MNRLLVCLLVSSVVAFARSDATAPTCGQSLDEAARSQDSMLKFSADLYKKVIAEKQNENVVFSPVSISLILSMLEAGAGGVTKTQLQSVLARADNADGVRNVYEALQKQLQQTPDVTLKLANGVYVDPTFSIKSQFTDMVKTCFAAVQEQCNFVSNAENCRQVINTFVADKTEQKIKELFKEGMIESDTVTVLVNALYLTASWENKFEIVSDRRTFYKLGQEEQSVQFMTTDNRKMSRKEIGNLKIVKVPLHGNMSMYIILPERNGLAALESSLTKEKLADFLTVTAQPERLEVTMPMFTARTSLVMNNIMKELGVLKMFDSSAEFPNISSNRNIFVTTMAHEGYIKVNEKGVEAAAATGAVIGLRTSPPRILVEHPFMFAIKHESTKSVLFLGRINSIDEQ